MPPKRKRKSEPKIDLAEDDSDAEILTSLDGEKSVSQYKKAKTGHVLHVTLNSTARFSATPMLIREGVFKGHHAILLKSEPDTSHKPSLMNLPPEIRNLIYAELFRGNDDCIHIADRRVGGRVRAYIHVDHPKRRGRPTTERVAPISRIAIFSTNRQLREETSSFFYGSTTFQANSVVKVTQFVKETDPEIVGLIQKLSITSTCSRWTMSEFCKVLPQFSSIQSLTLSARQWVKLPQLPQGHHRGGHDVEWSSWAYSAYGGRSDHGQILTKVLPFLRAIQDDRDDIDQVASIIRFETTGESCSCSPGPPWPLKPCDVLLKEIAAFGEALRQDIKTTLEEEKVEAAELAAAAEARKKKQEARKSKEEARHELHDLDAVDFSYLERRKAPTRRDTGRPKRGSTNDISYAEL